MKHYGDITKLSGYDLPVVDCICGGSPCQNLSVAGNQKGLEGSESRLFLEQVRIVREMLNNGRSNGSSGLRFMVWENVPGAMQTNGGRDFQRVLSEIVQICEPNAPAVPMPKSGKWTKSGCLYDDMGGWSVAWRIHNSEFWGVCQRRRRIALVADFRGLAAPEVLFERRGLCRDHSEKCGKGENVTAGVVKSAEKSSGNDINKVICLDDQGGAFINCTENKAATLRAQTHGHTLAVYCPDQMGNYKEDIKSSCISTKGNTAVRGDTVLVLENHPADGRLKINEDGIVQTLRNRMGTGGGNTPLLLEIYKKNNNSGEYVKGIGTLRASGGDYGGGSESLVVNGTGAVRRITPLEAERLQGYPDNWTNTGEWEDTKGKRHKEASDTARYKALGNSIALPFWFWLLRRISAQYERPATLGSLFDGIGGFPLCWERCNGPGTAIWASEIEEFPIAVTKKHFPE